jgi:cytochrome c553
MSAYAAYALIFLGGTTMQYLNFCKMQLAPLVALIMASMTLGSAYAGDVAAGKARAGMCATCHGPLGISQLPNAPNLAGQPEIYIAEQLKQYRSGKRANEVMAVIAKPLTDKDIEDLSAWYASIEFTVKEK